MHAAKQSVQMCFEFWPWKLENDQNKLNMAIDFFALSNPARFAKAFSMFDPLQQ